MPLGSLVGVGLALFAVALSAFFIYGSLQTRRAAADRVSHTLEVLRQAETVLSSLKDAETGQRGFLLTGEERYLEPYILARSELASQIKALRTLVSDNPLQLQRADMLDQLGASILEEIEQTIASRRGGDADAALRARPHRPRQGRDGPRARDRRRHRNR